MKKAFVYLFVITLLLSFVVTAEKYSYERFGISEIEIPATYYLLDEESADNSMISRMLFDSSENLKSNVPVVFVNDDDVSCITIETLDKVIEGSPGFLYDKATEKELATIKESLIKSGVANIELVKISGHNYFESMAIDGTASTLAYSMILNGLPVSFRIYNFAENVSSNQKMELQDTIESATFIIEKEKSGIEKFFASIFSYIRSYIGHEISDNLIWIIIGVGALVIWGLFALIAKIFKPRG